MKGRRYQPRTGKKTQQLPLYGLRSRGVVVTDPAGRQTVVPFPTDGTGGGGELTLVMNGEGQFVEGDTTVTGGGAPAAHAASHENAGGDEIDVTGLSGQLADPQIPDLHAAEHEDGGGDEIDVTGLAGVLDEPQVVDVDATGALDGDSAVTPLAVRVDGVTIQINGSNQLEVIGGGSGLYCEPLTDGDLTQPELIFALGDVIMVCV
jgi:hypothetical protein